MLFVVRCCVSLFLVVCGACCLLCVVMCCSLLFNVVCRCLLLFGVV